MENEKLSDADFGYPAWQGFISWAFETPEAKEQFKQETGLELDFAPTNPIDKMIDDQTGASYEREKTHHRFVLWATARMYGVEYAPPAVAEGIKADPQLAELLDELAA